MTSFKAMLIPTQGIAKLLRCTAEDRYLSYLPVAHGMERWLGECLPLYTGEYLFFGESIKSFVVDLNRCRPTLFLSVPRLWTKFQAGVFRKISDRKLRILLNIPIISFLVKKKILKGLGLNCVRFAGSGSAPIPESLIHWYGLLGLQLLEGYGMTETFNFSHLNQPGKTRIGYVGNTYEGVEHRIADEGEIQVKTPGMMMGYFKNEEATKESITEDGWVRTGDTGEIDELGRLKITGRIKEIFKTSKGKYVAPSPIENLLVAHSLVELACVGGQSYPQPHAILQLCDGAKADADRGDDERLKIAKELEGYIDVVNRQLDGHERLAFVVVVKEDWLPENGFLTPTQKIKRASIEDAYAINVDGWYTQKSKVVWHGW
jgi:long-chain acyl-CoA synthetase